MTTHQKRIASAPGKIILCGEYAVVFGHAGIAIPAKQHVEVTYEPSGNDWNVVWHGLRGDHKKADAYLHKILNACSQQVHPESGTLHITNNIPLGKGMGSSTALTIAISKAIFACHPERSRGTLRENVLAVENIVNPGHSGIDFSVIWEEKPVYFKKPNAPKSVDLPATIINALDRAILIDTGTPNETTPELVTWITMRHVQGDKTIEPAIHTIGGCAKRLMDGEDIASVIRDHHRAQIDLGIVSKEAQSLIKKIEQEGGSAKVIGAGGRTGGSGMVMAFDTDLQMAEAMGFEIIRN